MGHPIPLPDRRATSCGTCQFWTLKFGKRYCTVQDHYFDSTEDLTTFVCGQWKREMYKTNAVKLWKELHGKD